MHVIGRFTHIDCPPRPLETFTSYNKSYFPLSIGCSRHPDTGRTPRSHGSVTTLSAASHDTIGAYGQELLMRHSVNGFCRQGHGLQYNRRTG